jgi:hypothetical protein
MRHTKIVAAFFLGLSLMGLAPMGCGSNTVGPVRVTQTTKASRSNYPDKTVERFQGCVTEHGAQLGPGHHSLDATMDMDEHGLRYNVEITNLPAPGEDFGGCMRSALQDMVISEKLFDEAREKLKAQREEQQKAQKQLLGSPVVVVVGVTVVVTEVFLEAGAITILFATTVTLIDKAATDVMELAKRKRWENECNRLRTLCLGTSIQPLPGSVYGSGRCLMCAEQCKKDEGIWPSSVNIGGIDVPCR